MASQRICSIEGCDKPSRARGFCLAHYKRLRRHGDPLAGATSPGEPLKFLQNIVLPYKGDDCLIWSFNRAANGYAQAWNNGRPILVSRLVCTLIHGPAPTPKHHAAHTCGQGHMACVNPSHLVWKTPKENEADKIIHGTTSRGERCGNAKLTSDDVREIRTLLGTMPQRTIAERFDVSEATISEIKTGRKWQHLKE